MNRDFVEMLFALSDANVEYLVVGAHAVAVHAHPRATGDLDIWVNPTETNATNVLHALMDFGAPVDQLSVTDFSLPEMIVQLGFPPHRIDLITSITAVSFAEAWPDRVMVEVHGRAVPFISKAHLIRNKEAVGRARDLSDVAELRRQE